MIDNVLKASRLVYKGLQPKATPFKDKEYKELISLSLSSPEFYNMVCAIAEGLSLVVVDLSDAGIILSPNGVDSRFVMGLADYRKELEADLGSQDAQAKKGLVALVQVAIAATFFPTAEHLDDDDSLLNRSAKIKDIHDVLIAMSEKIVKAQETDDQEPIPPFLKKGGELILAMSEAMPVGKRPTLKSRYGTIIIVANHLEEYGLLKFEKSNEGGIYFPTYRYQKMLQRRAVSGLFELCHHTQQGMEEKTADV